FEQTNVILMFIPEGVGAFAEPAKNRMVMPIDLPDEELYALIKHELTHIFEYEILFQGRLGREIRANPPTWMMEGLASFMAEDEETTDRMVLRDAVVNDLLPSIEQPSGGYFAYRFGHAVFRFMTQKWGYDGLRDFLYEYRNSLGGSVERPIRRAFDLSVEEFDNLFRTWLRKQYLPALVTKGEPLEYGRRFRVSENVRSQEMSPVPAPSGDLLAAITTYKEDVDVVLFNVPERKLFRNISKGYPAEYEYIIAQFLTSAPVMGRDIAFHPSGDRIAFFVKKERGRHLLLVDALSGDIERSIPMEVEQQLNPTFSPDGSKVAFHAFSGNQADIFVYDLQADSLINLTDDEFFDAAPVYSPDGRWLVYSSVIEGEAKLFRLDLQDPARRYQITAGEWNDIDAWFSPDGGKIFYASDRPTGRTLRIAEEIHDDAETRRRAEQEIEVPFDPRNFAAYNIYSLDLESGRIEQYTDVIGGAFGPVVFTGEGGVEQMVFSSYYKNNWNLYRTNTDQPLRTVETVQISEEPVVLEERARFLPPIEVALNDDQFEDEEGFRLFVEHVDVNGGVTSDQTFVSRSVIYMSDMLGNRRFIASLDSVSTFSNFDFLYLDLRKRLSWGVRLFDDRTYYVTPDSLTTINRRRLYRQTGAFGLLSYPFDRYHRVDFGLGYMVRDIDYPPILVGGDGFSREDDFPIVSATFTGDSTIFKSFGPVSGRRYYITGQYLADLDEGGEALSQDVAFEFRQYFQTSARTLLAARVFGGYSDGTVPNFYYFGGLNTLRGYDFRSLVGNRAFYGNFEWRFPLIDVLASPFLGIRDIRGSLFFDIGGAWFDGQDFIFQEDGALVDAKAAVGYGISFRLLGLELHWDFARRTNLDEIEDQAVTSFWIGQTF
ncbi:MAG TPA: BamA/TamA family outer membrane protein, partial [Thermoanaerobaculia bacterium]|nr:BamA/TamA family outer membrane protein [Thermoanaerobaculia bacterium]